MDKSAASATATKKNIISQRVILELCENPSLNTRIDKPALRDRQATTLGSYFLKYDGVVSKEIKRALTPEQEKYLLPYKLIDFQADDNEFPKKVNEFWANYTVGLPEGMTSRELNADYYIDKVKIEGKEIEIEIPVNLSDYISYNFLVGNPNVAYKLEDLDRKSMFTFALIDKNTQKENQEKEVLIREEVDRDYIKLADEIAASNLSRADNVFQILKSKFVDIEPNYNGNIELKNALYKMKTDNPAIFHTFVNDKHLEDKAFISRAVEFEIIQKDDGIYTYSDNVIGDIKATIAFLQNKDNEVVKNLIKIKINDKLKIVKEV